MRKVTLRNSRIIDESVKPYIIAEVNTSHNGDIEVAKQMIMVAKEAGCDCVKFQSWSETSINSKNVYDVNPISKRFFKKFSLSAEELKQMAMFCKEIDISFSSTPYSREEVDFLIKECHAPFVKVASMDLNNYMYLDYIAKTGIPIILSTGLSEIEEVRKAVKTIEQAGNKNICLLHCISIYPPEISTINLKNILGLKNEFPSYPVGFSDHSLGIELASASVALGASIIEKHMTLDKSKIGMDNQMALGPNELTEMVKNCHNVHFALGNSERVVLSEEIEQRKKIRRSVVVNKDLKRGSTLSIDDLDVKRPGIGIPPEDISLLVGKILAKDVESDRLLSLEDLL